MESTHCCGLGGGGDGRGDELWYSAGGGGFSRLLGSGRARLASSERRVLVRTGYRSVNMFFCTRTR